MLTSVPTPGRRRGCCLKRKTRRSELPCGAPGGCAGRSIGAVRPEVNSFSILFPPMERMNPAKSGHDPPAALADTPVSPTGGPGAWRRCWPTWREGRDVGQLAQKRGQRGPNAAGLERAVGVNWYPPLTSLPTPGPRRELAAAGWAKPPRRPPNPGLRSNRRQVRRNLRRAFWKPPYFSTILVGVRVLSLLLPPLACFRTASQLFGSSFSLPRTPRPFLAAPKLAGCGALRN